jgi:hypothetical protein
MVDKRKQAAALRTERTIQAGEKPKYWEKGLSQRPFVHHKQYTDRPTVAKIRHCTFRR